MDDDALTRFRKPPRPEFEAALYRKISQPAQAPHTQRRLRPLAAAASAAVLAVALLLATPRGRALAQQILEFFVPAQSNSFILPTRTVSTEPALAPTAIPSALAGCEEAPASLTYQCAVGNAEAALRFDIRELPGGVDMHGFTFAGATVEPEQGGVWLAYAREGGELRITQIRGEAATVWGPAWEATWGAVPPASVETVQVRGVHGEYVRGMFVVKDMEGNEAFWEPDAPVQRLRWREGDMQFEIFLGGLPGDDEAIGKDWLIALAEDLR
jgi:hypothetical protein